MSWLCRVIQPQQTHISEGKAAAWSKPTEQSMKLALMRTAAGLPPFGVNRPFLPSGGPSGGVHGFFRMANRRAKKISAEEYRSEFETLPTERVRLKPGGTIIIGLTMDTQNQRTVELVERYLPDLLNEALGEALPPNMGWTIGRLGYGRYVTPDGTVFDERSTTITLRNVGSQELERVAKAVMVKLNQQAVILVDDSIGESALLQRAGPNE